MPVLLLHVLLVCNKRIMQRATGWFRVSSPVLCHADTWGKVKIVIAPGKPIITPFMAFLGNISYTELDTQKRTRESVTQATKKGRERGRVHALIFFWRTNIKSVIIIFMKLYFLLSTFFFSSFYIYSSFYYKKGNSNINCYFFRSSPNNWGYNTNMRWGTLFLRIPFSI